MKLLKTSKIQGGKIAAFLAAVLVFGAATTVQAAQVWTGNSGGNWATSGNWNGTTGRRYIRKSGLSGDKSDIIYLSANVTETSHTGLCFSYVPDSGYWRFHGQNKYTFDNSGKTGTDYDQDLICIGYGGAGSSARFYAITLKTRHLTVGGDATHGGYADTVKHDMTGRLVLDNLDDNAVNELGPVSITATRTVDLYKGDLYATNANITCSGNMTAYDFYAEKTGGDWTLNGDLVLGAKAGATATFTQNSGTVTVGTSKWTKSTDGNGILNLNGGTFVTQHIQDEVAGGSLTVNFNGGTLKANNVHSAGLITHGNGAGLNVNVGADGGTIDTGNLNITIPVAVNAVSGTAGSFTVTGGGSATFSGQGNLVGALIVGDNTELHWFDQDGAVSASCGFTSLALGAGSTIYLNGDATGVDAFPATVTTTATTESKANVVIDFSAIPATGSSFTLFQVVSADVFNVSPMFGSLVLPHEVAVVNGNLVLTLVADNYTWNGSQTNWGDVGAWTKGGASATWADGNNAIFNTANATATLAAGASAAKIEFSADATVNGSATLSVPVVDVASGVAATISAPTADPIEKTGAGALTLGSSRTDQTTLSEGTLKMASGATVDASKLTLGTDAAKPVVLDYGAQTLSAASQTYLGGGMDVTLTNGTFAFTSAVAFSDVNMPASLTIAKDATLSTSERFIFNTATARTIKVDGGELDLTGLSSSKNAWIMQNSSGTLRIDAANALLKANGYVYAGTGHDSEGLSPKLDWTVLDSTFIITGNGLFLGNRGNQPMSRYPVTPQVTFAMTNSVFYTEKGFILGQNPTDNTSQTAGFYIADFDHCTVTSKLCRVYGDRPANAIRFNGVTLVSNGNGDSWIDAVGFADGATPVTVGADGLEMDNNGYAMTVTANLGGTGAVTKTGNGKLTIAESQTSTGALSCEAGETFVNGGLTINRPTTVKDGATLTVNATAQSTFASLAFESGSTLNIESYAVDVTAIAAPALALPASGTVELKFNGGAFPIGRYAILEKAGITVADVDGRFVLSVSAGAPSWEVSGDTLYLVVKSANDCIWTGAGSNAKFSNGANWQGGNIPASGANVFIALATAGEIECDIADFSPASITFPANSAAVTITGENAINGVVSVTNLSANSHTIDVPVYFAGDIQVKQAAMAEVGDLAKAHVTFAGGAYAAPGYALENDSSAAVYSRCIFGRYYLAKGEDAPWTAMYQNSNRRVCLADNSTLYIPYAGALTELYIGNNAHVDVGKMTLTADSRVSYRNNGEMAVTNLTLTGTGDRSMSHNQGTTVSPVFKFERIDTSMTVNWCYFADGNAASRGVYYIGAGGLNFSSSSATGSYCVGKDVANDAQTIRPWYSDFTIGDRGNGSACFVMNRDVTFCTDDESGTGRTITMDAIARGYGAAPTVTVSGSGTLRVNKSAKNTTQLSVAVTNTATLALKPGAIFTTSTITVNSGAALQVAEAGTLALGGDLALKAGATLGFNYTTRDAPVLDLTDKTVTFDEGATTNVVVKITASEGRRGRGGVRTLTSGGKFADATVSLAAGAPTWVKGVSVVDGDIVLNVKSTGMVIIIK